MARYSERRPDTYPRWALLVKPYDKLAGVWELKPVLIANLDHHLKENVGSWVLCREDAEMFQFTTDEPEGDVGGD